MATPKQQLRQTIRSRKQALTPQQWREGSAAVMERLLNHPRILGARAILMYHSLPDEVHTHDALERLVGMGKTVLLPVVVGDGEMVVRPYQGEGNLREGAYNILEPSPKPTTDSPRQGSATQQEAFLIDVAVVPGMAFDAQGHRLGRGKGYYDRFLRRHPHIYKIGVGLGFQMVDAVPHDAFDVGMDEVIAQ